jgi:hypothetical protein
MIVYSLQQNGEQSHRFNDGGYVNTRNISSWNPFKRNNRQVGQINVSQVTIWCSCSLGTYCFSSQVAMPATCELNNNLSILEGPASETATIQMALQFYVLK